MRSQMSVIFGIIATLFMALGTSFGQSKTAAGAQKAVVMMFADGHRQSIPFEDIVRIEFNSGAATLVLRDGHQQKVPFQDIVRMEFNPSSSDSGLGRNYFVGKWKVGISEGGGTFFITLDPNGEAHKTLGASHGTWAFVDGEARIAWDDGWHDAIRKVGSKHEKLAYEPGKTFSDPPSNVTDAKNLTAQPI
jgi:hypothetical protein